MRRILSKILITILLMIGISEVEAQSRVSISFPVDVSEQYVESFKRQNMGRVVMTNATEKHYCIEIVSREDGEIYRLDSGGYGSAGNSFINAYFMTVGDYYILSSTAEYPIVFNGRHLYERDTFTVSLGGNYFHFNVPLGHL